MPKNDMMIQAYTLLSQRLSNIDPDYADSACVHPDEAELIGFCKAYIKMFGKSEFSTWLDKQVIPALRMIGLARWPRSELTNLGLRIGARDELVESLGSAETDK